MPQSHEEGFSFKALFVPFNSLKAIHWIVIIGLIVYGNMLFNGFVYDDIKYIQRNAEIQTIQLSTIFGKSLFNATGQYRPIPALYHSVMYFFFGAMPFMYHIAQLFLHITNAVVVYLLFKKFFNNGLSFFLSLIFLIHPIQVESVSYMSGITGPLFFFFGMVSILLSFKNTLSWIRVLVLFFLLLVSFLAKETGFLFLCLVLLCAMLFSKKNIYAFLLGGFLTVASYSLIRFGIGGVYFEKFSIIPIHKLTFAQRLLNIPEVLFYYVNTFFFPTDLAISQNWVIKTITFSNFYFPLCMDVLFVFLLIVLGRYVYIKNREVFSPYLFFVSWLGMGMVLHSQIIPLDMTVADRWFYFTIVGFLGYIGVFLGEIRVKRKQFKTFGMVAAGIILLLLSFRTIVRNTNWVDQKTLLTHDISVRDDYTLEDLLGIQYLEEKQYGLAAQHMVASIRLNPDPTNINNLGVIYQLGGNYKKAKEAYYYALQSKENSNKIYAYINLSSFLVYHDDPSLAIPILKNNLLKSYPNVPRYWLLLAVAEYKVGKVDEALQIIQKAHDMWPQDPDISNIYVAITNKVPANTIIQVNQTISD